MKISFIKMVAAGNDYIYLDLREGKDKALSDGDKARIISDGPCLAKRMSDRRFGVGGDGLILIDDSKAAHCKMTVFNGDGSRALMCGNALRSVASIVREDGDQYKTVETDSGVRRVFYGPEGVTAHMGKCKYITSDEGAAYPKQCAEIVRSFLSFGLFSVGNPHLAAIVPKEVFADFGLIAPLLAKNQSFDGGVNVELGYLFGGKIITRVYERGSGETLSCGTGACAISSSAVKGGLIPHGKVRVSFKGGDLFVEVKKGFDCYLAGDTYKSFTGVFYD